MGDIVIQVEDLAKQYRLGLVGGTTLHEDLSRWWAKLRGKPDTLVNAPQQDASPRHSATSTHKLKDDADHVWAVRDISFEVKRGEILGLIGHNGAGKSTLLKILTRITAPTLGEVRLKGRVASLLEVGTGFHPELTGRENVLLNGAILGMSLPEIRKKMDSIIDFSGCATFIDTPVKRYSSGMYVRLAFSVAAHLESDILLVDEVLAVGDVAFQKKCLGKMRDVATSGRTVLFVSHNMGAVADLCTTAMLLEHGGVRFAGHTEEVVEHYLASHASETGSVDLSIWTGARTGEGNIRCTSATITNGKGEVTASFRHAEPIVFNMTLRTNEPSGIICGISVRNSRSQLLLHLANTDTDTSIKLPAGESTIHVTVPSHPLNDGDYFVTFWIGDMFNVCQDRVADCIRFVVDNKAIGGSTRSLAPVLTESQWCVGN